MRDLSELAETYFQGSPKEMMLALAQIDFSLSLIKAKFVDIDTSFTEIDEADYQQFLNKIKKFADAATIPDLLDIYEALHVYLLVKDRFGEAADWNFKDEYERRLKSKAISALESLSKVSYPLNSNDD